MPRSGLRVNLDANIYIIHIDTDTDIDIYGYIDLYLFIFNHAHCLDYIQVKAQFLADPDKAVIEFFRLATPRCPICLRYVYAYLEIYI